MIPSMYGAYRQLGAPAGAVVIVDGVQKLTPLANGQIAGYLSQLYFGTPVQSSPAEGVQTFLAMPCDQAKQSGGPTACAATVLDSLESIPGSSVVVDFGGASPTNVMVTIVTGTAEVSQNALLRQIAGTDSNLALFEPSGVKKTKDKDAKKEKTTTMLVGAGAGGAAGFFTFGPPGAIVGAATGAVLANWLTA